ncbi:MAG: zinc metallopeptidase [Proteobacteria bacterium]|nr:zinc metallopeptidase [Pseudomonadota bacterium]
MGIGAVLSFGAQAWVKASFARWSQVPTGGGKTGADVAKAILRAEGITNVSIEPVPGMLSDHYDPRSKTLRLSPDVYGGRSVASAGIAAHEVGHALQDAQGYLPMRFRQALVPVANIGTQFGIWMVIIGGFIGFTGLAKFGVLLFAGFVAFTIITLPVELDASWRARRTLEEHHLLDGEELSGVTRMLTAAAGTYLAAAATAVLQLIYWAYRAGLIGGRRRD